MNQHALTEEGSTLIDLIITNIGDRILASDTEDFSELNIDPNPVYCNITTEKIKSQAEVIRDRSYFHTNMEIFYNDAEQAVWSDIYLLYSRY